MNYDDFGSEPCGIASLGDVRAALVPRNNEGVSLRAHVSHIQATTCGRLSTVPSILVARPLDLIKVKYSVWLMEHPIRLLAMEVT